MIDGKSGPSGKTPQHVTGSVTKSVTFNEPENESSSQDVDELVKDDDTTEISDTTGEKTVNKSDDETINSVITTEENTVKETELSTSDIEMPTVSQLLETLGKAHIQFLTYMSLPIRKMLKGLISNTRNQALSTLMALPSYCNSKIN